ncbi:hypothetical protein QFZ56_003551 [Streptomyces achromogenes]|uniref:Uncharacterized protein n=1 Tax=Streptomyces achromogenes TaxID=67255 RepID=A0ABU0Q1P9_STRAH|nr:hypothetical protein [Streptomyces achromogenes]MDQ0684588.1 hypothetical protein [Streptomyces achromogenes]
MAGGDLLRIGEVMGHVGGRVQLGPVGGGREWDRLPEDVEEATPGDVLRERVRRLNRDALRHGGDLEHIARITGRSAEWVVERGTVP